MPDGERGHISNHVKSDLLRWILICVGWISIVSGVIGLFLPLLPSVPFLLLAVFCFSRSSVRFHNWLVEHRHFGPMLRDYLKHGGIPLRAKIIAIGMIWISFPVSVAFLIENFWIKVLLIAIAAAVTLYLLALPTVTKVVKTREIKPEE